MDKAELEARKDELEAQLAKLRDQGMMLSGALAEVRRQLETLEDAPSKDKGIQPALRAVDN